MLQKQRDKVMRAFKKERLSTIISTDIAARGINIISLNYVVHYQLPDQDEYSCFIAMVETLHNRLTDDNDFIKNVGLVIVDEAHYNSFRKIFQYYEDCNILGVTATPLSSNKSLPLKDNYNRLLVGESIAGLIEKSYLSNADTFSYDVNLHGLKIGTNGDFTITSSDMLYSNYFMQEKLIFAYEGYILKLLHHYRF